jgi:hypothetical protein
MTFDQLFVIFGIPAITLVVAYAAVLANERAARRLDQHPGE